MANEKVWTPEQREAAAIAAITRVWKSATPQMVSKHAKKMLDMIDLQCELTEVTAERDQMDRLINTPSTGNFLSSVELEAAHQVLRWASEHDAGKTDADWFWLIGYLAGKVMRPEQTTEKRLHHIITTAAVCLNWHRHVTGEITEMRPSIEPPAEGKPTCVTCGVELSGAWISNRGKRFCGIECDDYERDYSAKQSSAAKEEFAVRWRVDVCTTGGKWGKLYSAELQTTAENLMVDALQAWNTARLVKIETYETVVETRKKEA